MTQTLNLKIFLHEEHGLSLTVRKTTVDTDGDEKQTTTTERTDSWLPSSICSAVTEIVTEYLDTIGIQDGAEPTPIEVAAGVKPHRKSPQPQEEAEL